VTCSHENEWSRYNWSVVTIQWFNNQHTTKTDKQGFMSTAGLHHGSTPWVNKCLSLFTNANVMTKNTTKTKDILRQTTQVLRTTTVHCTYHNFSCLAVLCRSSTVLSDVCRHGSVSVLSRCRCWAVYQAVTSHWHTPSTVMYSLQSERSSEQHCLQYWPRQVTFHSTIVGNTLREDEKINSDVIHVCCRCCVSYFEQMSLACHQWVITQGRQGKLAK